MSDNNTERAVKAALARVIDPELRRPITELNMVKSVAVADDGTVNIEIYLTTEACPKKAEIAEKVRAAAADAGDGRGHGEPGCDERRAAH